MKLIRHPAIVFLFFSFLSQTNIAQAQNFSAGFEVGPGNLDVDPEYSLINKKASVDVAFLQGYLAYDVIPNLSAEISYFSVASSSFFDLIDQYRFKGYQILFGYQINLGKVVSITPELGHSFWRFEAEQDIIDGSFTETSEGSDFIAQISLNFNIGKNKQAYVTYADNEYKFGKMHSTRFGMKFKF